MQDMGAKSKVAMAEMSAAGDAAGGGMTKAADETEAASGRISTDVEDAAGGFPLLSGASKKAEEDVAKDAEKMGGHSSVISKAFQSIGNAASNMGIPFSGALKEAGSAADEAGEKTSLLGSALGGIPTMAVAAGAALAVGVAYESIKAADAYQQSTATLAASAGISTKAATAIGNAFLTTAGKTTFSAQAIMTAYGPVAAQLATVQGHALNSKEAMTAMSAAMDLAEGTGSDLSSTTGSLAQVMQAYGLNVSKAAGATDVMFETSEKTGNSVGNFASTVARMHSQLGAVTPSLGQVGGLLVDLAQHGVTGRQGLSAVQTAMQTMLKPSSDLQVAIADQKTALDALPASLKVLASGYESGKLTSLELQKATYGLGGPQKALFAQFTSAATAVQKANLSVKEMGVTTTNAQGTFVGMGSVLAQLHQKIQGESQAQALATLQAVFGASANRKLLDVVEAGPAAFDKDTSAVSKSGTAHAAAAKMAATFHGTMEKLISTVEDLAVKIGQALLPVVQKLVPILSQVITVVADVILWMIKHRNVVEWVGAAIALLIGGPITALIGAFILVTKGLHLLGLNWGDIFRAIKTVVMDVWGWVDKTIVPALILDFHLVSAGVHILGDVFTDVFDDIKKVIEAIIGPIETAVGLVSKVSSIGGSLLKHVPGGGLVSGALHSFGLAEGGIVNRPTLSLVGEHGPEVVVPMNDIGRAIQLLGQAGLLSQVTSAAAASGGFGGGAPATVRIAGGGGGGSGGSQQFEQLMSLLLQMMNLLTAQRETGEQMLVAEKGTTMAVKASASQIVRGITDAVDETSADLAHELDRKLR